MRADRASDQVVSAATVKLLGEPAYTNRASELGMRMATADPAAALREVLVEATS